jgi:hypothetical protein
MSTKKRLPQPWLKGGRTWEVRQAGTITNDLHALEKLLRRIRGDREPTLHVCYEAGTCDFVIADCVVQDREVCALYLVNFDSLVRLGLTLWNPILMMSGSIRFGRDVYNYTWTVFSSRRLRAYGALLRLCGRAHISSKRQERAV